jgi:hypothetical protein
LNPASSVPLLFRVPTTPSPSRERQSGRGVHNVVRSGKVPKIDVTLAVCYAELLDFYLDLRKRHGKLVARRVLATLSNTCHVHPGN